MAMSWMAAAVRTTMHVIITSYGYEGLMGWDMPSNQLVVHIQRHHHPLTSRIISINDSST